MGANQAPYQLGIHPQPSTKSDNSSQMPSHFANTACCTHYRITPVSENHRTSVCPHRTSVELDADQLTYKMLTITNDRHRSLFISICVSVLRPLARGEPEVARTSALLRPGGANSARVLRDHRPVRLRFSLRFLSRGRSITHAKGVIGPGRSHYAKFTALAQNCRIP